MILFPQKLGIITSLQVIKPLSPRLFKLSKQINHTQNFIVNLIMKGRKTTVFVEKIARKYIFELDQEELKDFEEFLKRTDGKGLPSMLTYIRHRFQVIIDSFKEEN